MPSLAKDKRLRRLLKTVDKGLYDYPFDKVLKEAQELHQDAAVRKLSSKALRRGGADKLLKANTQTQTYRSRITEMLSQSSQFRNNLRDEVKYLTDYLQDRYGDSIEGRTKEERQRPINVALEPVMRLLGKYDSLIETLRLILADFDQAYWSIRENREIVGLINSRREYNV